MFGVADVRRLRGDPQKPDIGRLLDAALFYGRVHLSMDMALFTELSKSLGPEGFSSLLDHHAYSAEMTPQLQAVMPNAGIMASYRPVAIQGHYTSDTNASSDPIDIVKRAFAPGRPGVRHMSEIEIDNIFKKIKLTTIEKLMPVAFAEDIWLSLATDIETIKLAIPVAAARKGLLLDLEALNAAEFRVTKWNGGVAGWSSVQLEKIALGSYQNRLTWADIFADIDDYRMDLCLSKYSMADLLMNEKSETFYTNRLDVSLNRAHCSEENVSAFISHTMGSMGSLGEAYNAGGISLTESLKIIDEASKFKQWISDQPFDVNLTSEYIKKISSTGYFNKWPGRELKFTAISAAGLATAMLNPALGAATGLALGAFDSYFLSEITKGWRPNMFISNVKKKIS